MRTTFSQWLIVMILITLIMSACNSDIPTSTIGRGQTKSTESDQSQILMLDLSSPAPTNPPTETIPPATTTTSKPSPTTTQDGDGEENLATKPAVSTAPQCSNQAEYIKSLNLSDNVQIKPGDTFTKVWLVKNVGTCTWTENYALVLTNGDAMQSPELIPLLNEVKPGETIELRANMIAPSSPNTYFGEWVLQDEDGNRFTFKGAAETLGVKIVVPQILDGKPG